MDMNMLTDETMHEGDYSGAQESVADKYRQMCKDMSPEELKQMIATCTQMLDEKEASKDQGEDGESKEPGMDDYEREMM